MMPLIRNLLASLATVLVVACSSPGGTGANPAAPATSAPSATAAASPSPASVSCVERTLAAMSEDQRIGQLFLLGLAGNRFGPEESLLVREGHVGSVWFTERSTEGRAAVGAVARAVQAETTPANNGDVGFLVAANQEGGLTQALQGPGFSTIPSAVDQGALAPALLQARAGTWGHELAAAGVNLDFAPVADVVPPGFDQQNEPIGVLRRGFGHDAVAVGGHVAAFVHGLHAAGVAATLKHFPGLGRVTGNTDFKPATDAITSAPDGSFADGIDAGADFVMVALARYDHVDPQHLAVFSPAVISGLLQSTLGFKGVIVSDDLGATAAVSGIPYGERATAFLEAGGDMVVSKTAPATTAMILALRARSASDAAFRQRIAQSAARVLAAKETRGLLRC